jgi:hypothetical protein
MDGIEVLSISAPTGNSVTISELSLGDVDTLETDNAAVLIADNNTITGQEAINLLGFSLAGSWTLNSASRSDAFLVDQSVIDQVDMSTATVAVLSDADFSDTSKDVTGSTIIMAGTGTITGAYRQSNTYVLSDNGDTFVSAQMQGSFNTVSGGDGEDTIFVGYDLLGGVADVIFGGLGADLFSVDAQAIGDGLRLADFNLGTADDSLELDVGTGFQSTSSLFTSFFTALTYTDASGDTQRVDPYTASGGLKILDAASDIVTIAEGSALGNAVPLRGFASTAALTAFMQALVAPGLQEDSFAVFGYLTGTGAAAGGIIVGVVGNNDQATTSIATSETAVATLASFLPIAGGGSGPQVVTYSDITLI